MLLAKFLQYFGRVSPNDPRETTIEFRPAITDDEKELSDVYDKRMNEMIEDAKKEQRPFTLKAVTYDVEKNKWIIELN